MKPYLQEEYGNPSSKHYKLATNASKAVEWARQEVAKLINAEPEQIIFTSSGTESNNFIIKGAADYLKNYENKGGHLLTSSVEHMSVINSFNYLNGEIYNNRPSDKKINRGYDCEILDVDNLGLINLDKLKKSVREDTILASFIWVNNETGNINDIESIVKYLSSKGIFTHSDATQAVGKLDIDVKKLEIDALSFSAHKIYGPKGCGAAYVKDVSKMSALIHGGAGQEEALRSGTLCVHNIVGFGMAAKLIRESREKDLAHVKELEDKFKDILKEKYPDVYFVSDEKRSLPGLLSFIIPGVNSDEKIIELKDKLAMSSGSACSAGGESPVLKAIGRPEAAANFFRVGFNRFNTLEDLELVKDLI